jgi:hypothetical protein
LEQLEDRSLPSNFTAFTVSDLIADIKSANNGGGTNTITLTASTSSPYVLTAVDNGTDGPTGLPVIKKGDTLTIVGNGDTIERSTASGTPDFRLFDVASGASLTLETVTLQYGLEDGSGNSAEGGAIYNQGTLVLSRATVQNNEAEGSNGADAKSVNQNGGNGQDAAGGGIWSDGSLTLQNGTLVQNNTALGGNGGNPYTLKYYTTSNGGNGANGSGGGVDVAGGTANLSGGTLSGNVAEGGLAGAGHISFGNTYIDGGYGGVGFGGGVVVTGGTVELTGVTVDSNQAIGNSQPPPPGAQNGGTGQGGGVCVLGGVVSLSSDTVDSNSAAGEGGGLGLFGGSVTVSGGTVDSNSAGYLGGGVFAWGAGTTVTLCNLTVEFNTAYSEGGIGISSGPYEPTVYIDSFTVAHTINNTDSSGLNGSTANIDGTYILKSC